ncbi:MAG: VPS10 domain-containing protein [Candidatus Aminicenantia bacterium]
MMRNTSIFRNLKWRCVGPEFMGGRITDIEIPQNKEFTIYIGVASGNVWKTENNCTTWTPIFDGESTFTIGDIAIAPSNPEIIWVGTGESNSSRSSYAGTGVFKSTDGGKTWKNMGLHDSHHIGRIIIHPENPNIVFVAVVGHLFTENEERGLFKTTDGGKTWKKVLYINSRTGVSDVVFDPSDPNIIYAASWERIRRPWNFIGSGEGSGIWKSTDGGETWKRLTNGFPTGKNVGRIGIALSPSNPNVIYALLDNQAQRQVEKKEGELEIENLKKMSKEEFIKLEPKKLERFLRKYNVPKEYRAEVVISMVKNGEITIQQLYNYLMDANRALFEANVVGAEVYRSDDKGETWKKANEKYIDNFYYSYGYYFGNIRVSPDDENQIYILGVSILKSDDGGKTFRRIDGRGVHADHHALWIDPKNPERLILGNDGGINISYDRGRTWQKINNLPIGQFYTVTVDMEKPYNIYGGLQDNGVLYGPSTHVSEFGVPDPWKSLYGGDGAYVQVDPLDSNIVYVESQFGNIARINKKNGGRKNIKPIAKINEPPLRYNWQTPYLISPHNPFTIYYGANKVFKSLNRGDTWICISPDLTTNPQPQGNVPYGTITTLSESPLKPGLIYAGTDDGNLWVTKNDGVTWEIISSNLPKKWVSRVVASKYEEGTVFVSLTGYRDDDFEKYLYISTDFGKTWKSISEGLPSESINVIREDPEVKDILYLGTDLGVYVSINRGKSWYSLCGNLPTTPVHDLIVHPRDTELVIGTHGRSVYVIKVDLIQKMIKDKIYEKEMHLFEIKPVDLTIARVIRQTNAEIYIYLKKPLFINVLISDKSGKVIRKIDIDGIEGINRVEWDLLSEKGERITEPGEYKVEVSAGESKLEGIIKLNPPVFSVYMEN